MSPLYLENPYITYLSEVKDDYIIYSSKDYLFKDYIKREYYLKQSFNDFSPLVNLNSNDLFGHQIIVCAADDELLFFDQDLVLVARMPFHITRSFTKNGFSIGKIKNEPYPLLATNTGEYIALYSLKRNYHLEVLWSFIFSSFSIIVILYYFTPFAKKSLIYTKFFNYSLFSTHQAVVIINSKNEIIFSNKLFEEIQNNISINYSKRNMEIGSNFELTSNNGDLQYRAIHIPVNLFGKYLLAHIYFIEDQTKALLRERSQVWSHAIQKVAHEIKTPLSSINLNLKYIQNTLKKDDRLNPLLESDFSLIKNEVDRIKNLTNNLLKFANLQPPSKETVFLDEIMTKSFEKFESYTSHEVRINYKIDDPATKVEVDYSEFLEVMHVLVENAIDAISARGAIS
ncbi:MAG: hypothetical protein K9J12_14030, partial [Melioribacteraceae bacterium]|nr:hypothetical protein [Melioribacteraceae bacterium]